MSTHTTARVFWRDVPSKATQFCSQITPDKVSLHVFSIRTEYNNNFVLRTSYIQKCTCVFKSRKHVVADTKRCECLVWFCSCTTPSRCRFQVTVAHTQTHTYTHTHSDTHTHTSMYLSCLLLLSLFPSTLSTHCPSTSLPSSPPVHTRTTSGFRYGRVLSRRPHVELVENFVTDEEETREIHAGVCVCV